jgi:demethylmenaquinone methyltransferase/2-methoxy-6-polyprenyl-1,4-benzoquinol methylase
MTDTSPTADDIRTLFDRIAPVYDDLNERLSFGLHRVWKQMTVDWSGARPGDSVLDVCCGSGDLAILLAKRVGQTGQVYGVDFAEAQLEIAQQKAARLFNLAPIRWIKGDALCLPFEDSHFDAVTMAYGLRNLVDIPQGLQELQRVLKPASRVAILDFHRPSSRWLRLFQQWYLAQVVVPTAERCALTNEYAYLGPSLDRFPTGTGQVNLARQAGFSEAVHYAIGGGLMGILVATR